MPIEFTDNTVHKFLVRNQCDTEGTPEEKRERAAAKSEEMGDHLQAMEIRSGKPWTSLHAHRLISEIHGASLFRGATRISDYYEITLEQAARAEAYSRQCAVDSRLSTTVSPSNGIWVSWNADADCDGEAKKEFEIILRSLAEQTAATEGT